MMQAAKVLPKNVQQKLSDTIDSVASSLPGRFHAGDEEQEQGEEGAAKEHCQQGKESEGSHENGLSNANVGSALASPATDVRRWSHADVLRWLIDSDLSAFLPCFLSRGVTGIVLERIAKDEIPLGTLLDCPPAAATAAATAVREDPIALEALKTQLRHICAPPKKSAKDKGKHNNKENGQAGCGQPPPQAYPVHEWCGWTYEDERQAWEDLWDAQSSRAIADNIRAQQMRAKNNVAIAVLVCSALTSTLSVATLGNASGLASDILMWSTVVLTFLVTTLAAYAKLVGFDDRIAAMDAYMGKLELCLEHGECLRFPPHERVMGANAYQQKRIQLWRDAERVEMSFVTGSIWNDGLCRIYLYDRNTWETIFSEFYNTGHSSSGFRARNCACLGQGPVLTLTDPTNFDNALNDWSGKRMRKYLSEGDPRTELAKTQTGENAV